MLTVKMLNTLASNLRTISKDWAHITLPFTRGKTIFNIYEHVGSKLIVVIFLSVKKFICRFVDELVRYLES